MRELLVTRGIVLRETETRDSDKILTLLTPEGKLPVIARKARRKNCRYAAAAQELVYGEWTLYHRGEWYFANEGTTLALFEGLRSDLTALALGCYFAELTEGVTAEEESAEELLRHLLNGLYALAVLGKSQPLTKAAFELRLLCLTGYAPLVHACAVCGRIEPEEPVLDILQGVLRCRRCGRGKRDVSLCRDSLMALRHIVNGDARRLYSFHLSGEPLGRLSSAAEAFLLAQLDRRFRTLEYYKSLQTLSSGE